MAMRPTSNGGSWTVLLKHAPQTSGLPLRGWPPEQAGYRALNTLRPPSLPSHLAHQLHSSGSLRSSVSPVETAVGSSEAGWLAALIARAAGIQHEAAGALWGEPMSSTAPHMPNLSVGRGLGVHSGRYSDFQCAFRSVC